jgi:hypothetical protein
MFSINLLALPVEMNVDPDWLDFTRTSSMCSALGMILSQQGMTPLGTG